MAILTAVVSSNADDGHEWFGSWYIDGDSPGSFYSGKYSGAVNYATTRFQVNLANTVTVNAATWRLYANGSQAGTPLLEVFGDDVDNSAVPSGSAFPSARTPTTAIVSKNLTSGEWGTAGWVTLDVTSIITEILSRGGWSSGNYLTLVMYGTAGSAGNDYVGFEDYSAAGTNHAELVIDYTAAGTPTANISYNVGGGVSSAPVVTIPGVAGVSNSVSGGVSTAPTASVPVTSDSVEVSTTADDGCLNGGVSGFSTSSLWLGAGDYGNSTAFWIFRGVNIPQGVLLASASLDYYVSYQFNRPDLRFYAIDADDISTITSGNLLTLPRTSAYTNQSYSARPSGGNSVNAWASATPNIGAPNILAAVQEVVNRPGWVSGNDIAIVCEKTGGDGYAFVVTNDYTDSSANAAVLNFAINTNPQINSVGTIRTGSTFTVNGYYLGSTTGATLTHVASGATQAQTVGAVTATSVQLTCVEGNVPPGEVLLTLTGGSAPATYTVTKLPSVSTYDWVEMSNPFTDTSSIGYGMSPALATGDRIEYQNATSGGGDITLLPTGVWGGGSITFRRWIESTGLWDAEGWITHTVSFFDGASVASSAGGGVSSAPTATGTTVVADMTGAVVCVGTTAGQIPVTKKIRITGSNPVVNTMGASVTNNYDRWFVTQSNIDLSNYNGTAITVVANGTGLQITSGIGEVSVSTGLQTGASYRLVAFDDDLSHYFRFNGTIYEE